MENEKKIIEFQILLDRLFDGEATEQEVIKVQRLIQTEPDLKQYYFRCVELKSGLHQLKYTEVSPEFSSQNNGNMLSAFAEYEKTAPAIEVPKSKRRRRMRLKGKRRPAETANKQKGSKPRKYLNFMLHPVVLRAAALIFIVLVVRYIIEHRTVQVATLVDQMNVQWTDSNTAFQNGSRLRTNQSPISIDKGIVQIQYDDDVDVLIEGPAQFRIERSEVYLEYGSLFSRVPESGEGFRVETPTTRMVDLGTEFAVRAEEDGSAELHVIKGEVQLFTSSAKDAKSGQIFTQDEAIRYNAKTRQVAAIQNRPDSFVRFIDSISKTVWRGQTKLDLTDVLGGGNGLGTGQIDVVIDPVSGHSPEGQQGRRPSGNDYHLVSSNPFVDGVFVPNGQTQQVISSQGHLFQECPETSGLCCYNISYDVRNSDWETLENPDQSASRVLHCLLIHSNIGITFDLQAIRELLPDAKITRFRSQLGMREAIRPEASNADFWVLVDGQLRYQQQQVKAGQKYSLDIKLSDKDRFLTLIETDGGDPEIRKVDDVELVPIDSDWGLFADPILVLD
jgi:hypothetical protein